MGKLLTAAERAAYKCTTEAWDRQEAALNAPPGEQPSELIAGLRELEAANRAREAAEARVARGIEIKSTLDSKRDRRRRLERRIHSATEGLNELRKKLEEFTAHRDENVIGADEPVLSIVNACNLPRQIAAAIKDSEVWVAAKKKELQGLDDAVADFATKHGISAADKTAPAQP